VNGIHTALVTPFAADGAVDLATFEALCARQLQAGIHGLVPCGTTGETPALTPEEWASLTRVAVEVAGGNVPVTVGVGTNVTASTVENCRAAKALGADQGLMVLPYYNKPNPRGHVAHLRAAAAVGLPLVVYHVPGRTGQRVDASLLALLASQQGVVAVKEATGDLRCGTEVIAATATPVLSGDDFSFLGLLAQGGAGCVSVVSNVAPEKTVAIYDHFRAGRVDHARGVLLELWELIAFLFSETNPVPCKAAMAALGLCAATTRLPLATWDEPLPETMVRRALA